MGDYPAGPDNGGEGDAHVQSDHIAGGLRAGNRTYHGRLRGGTEAPDTADISGLYSLIPKGEWGNFEEIPAPGAA